MRTVAIVGATGAVGRTMLSILEARDFPLKDLRLLASARSAGTKIETKWGEVEVEDLGAADPSGIDVALFSAGGSRSKQYAPSFVAAGATVVDNSSAFRMDPHVPLVVAQVNDHSLAGNEGIIANPNCTTMILMMAVGPLHRHHRLRRLVATSYQSVSGSGMQGMDVLHDETRLLIEDRPALQFGGWVDPQGDLYERPIGFNVLAMAGSVTDQGYTDEEWKLVNETRKILEAPGVAVEPTCVRVPVMVGHGLAATLFFEEALDAATALRLLEVAPGVEVWDGRTPTPLDSAGKDEVLVGRIRDTIGAAGGVNLWVVGDNLRKGAALNAVQIAELV